jgi:hypothetical protein
MRSDIRKYWRDPRFWRWWWEERVSGATKGFIAVVCALACAFAGLLGARSLAASEEAATFTTQRVVTVAGKTGAYAPPEVVTKFQTVTQPGETDVVTVRRDGRTVIRRAPGETVTVSGPVEERVVTKDGPTHTVVRTKKVRGKIVTTTETLPGTTQTLPGKNETVTSPGATETVTRVVTQTQPASTVTDKVTVTQEVTVTDEVTVTVTVTVPPGKP